MKKLDREPLEAGLKNEPVAYPEKTKTVTKSATDPGSGLINHPGKPNAFCYLNHHACVAVHKEFLFPIIRRRGFAFVCRRTGIDGWRKCPHCRQIQLFAEQTTCAF